MGPRYTGGTPPVVPVRPRLYRRGRNPHWSTAGLSAVLPRSSALAVKDRQGQNDHQCTADTITTHQSATFSGAGAPPIKTWRKQTTNGKTLTSIHSTRNLDSMEPELNILPAIVYLLLYQEHERRRRRQLSGPANGRAVLEMKGPAEWCLTGRAQRSSSETAVPSGAMLDRKGPAERCLTGRAQRSSTETAVPSGAVLEMKAPAERCLTGRAQRSGARQEGPSGAVLDRKGPAEQFRDGGTQRSSA
ncbi:hypothetical protein NDU88_004856 [Pleurodeles waltl]|uniref:Uncharacterized protein n=1 Tax=Pleurodeles waltl TaxID=8319 RepID=A0AAV7VKC0_PLEWA|nr:hypothetical protein NDU88_004856 [Pleurodeles waltl]